MNRRRGTIDRAVRVMFTKKRGLHGSPRLHVDLRDDGWEVSEKTIADSMRRQGLVARRIRRRNGLTRQDKTAPKSPRPTPQGLHRRPAERPLGRGHDRDPDRDREPHHLATVIDLYSCRLLGAATCLRP